MQIYYLFNFIRYIYVFIYNKLYTSKAAIPGILSIPTISIVSIFTGTFKFIYDPKKLNTNNTIDPINKVFIIHFIN